MSSASGLPPEAAPPDDGATPDDPDRVAPATIQTRAGAPPSAAPRRHRGQPRPLRPLSRLLRVLGPGLITGAADDDPSGITTYTQAGATFGLGQVWLALYMLPLLIAVQEMCGRIGLVTGRGISGVVRRHYRREVLLGAVLLVVVANAINVGTDLGAMAAAARLLVPGLGFGILVVAFAVIVLGLEIFIPYRHYARVLKVMTLSLLAYVLTGLVVAPDWGRVALAALVPNIHFDTTFLFLAVAVLGTTISPYLFFWQASEEVEEDVLHHRRHDGAHDQRRAELAKGLEIKRLRADTVLGMLASGVTNGFIIITAAVTLHAHGIGTVTTAEQAASALQPLVRTFPHAGDLARGLFAVGIIGTGLLAVPILAGSAAYGVAEAFGWREGLYRPFAQARGFYGVIAAATLVGLLINFLGVNPIQALVYTAVINGVAAVPLLVLILLVANNRAIMGEHVNGRLSNTIAIFTTLGMGAAAVATVVSLWWH
jgi:NRAMP (natural resistance-associated macrophage protein)-like metal ion transporter